MSELTSEDRNRNRASPREARNGIASVRRSIDVLFAFSRQNSELTLSEIAERTGLEAPTAHRIAATLVDAGLLSQDRRRGGYRLGGRLLELGFSVLDQIEVRRIAFPYLVAFHNQNHPKSASSLLVPDGFAMLNVERLPPREWSLLFGPQLGYRFAMHASAAGKAFLAALPPEERRGLLNAQPLEAWTKRTMIDPAEVESSVTETLARGFGVSDEEAVQGSRAIAAAILDASGRPVGAILAQASVAEIQLSEMVETISPRLVGTAAQISAALGHERQPFVRR